MSMKIVKNSQGFTLIELIISISIIAMITGLFLADYKSSNQKAVLNAAADQLAGDLRLAQSYALGAKKNEKNDNTVPAGGWGIRLRSITPPNNSSYEIFADSNSSGGSDQPQMYDGSDSIYRKNFLPGGDVNGLGKAPVVVESMSGFTVNPNNVNSIVFLPPDPAVYFDGVNAGVSGAVAEIILNDTRTGNKKKVIVNAFGLIDVENAQ
jgi:prepilin-type N-terminal cleavage/methylation domain-containing protein